MTNHNSVFISFRENQKLNYIRIPVDRRLAETNLQRENFPKRLENRRKMVEKGPKRSRFGDTTVRDTHVFGQKGQTATEQRNKREHTNTEPQPGCSSPHLALTIEESAGVGPSVKPAAGDRKVRSGSSPQPMS